MCVSTTNVQHDWEEDKNKDEIVIFSHICVRRLHSLKFTHSKQSKMLNEIQ
jgi:hypothetical protein